MWLRFLQLPALCSSSLLGNYDGAPDGAHTDTETDPDNDDDHHDDNHDDDDDDDARNRDSQGLQAVAVSQLEYVKQEADTADAMQSSSSSSSSSNSSSSSSSTAAAGGETGPAPSPTVGSAAEVVRNQQQRRAKRQLALEQREHRALREQQRQWGWLQPRQPLWKVAPMLRDWQPHHRTLLQHGSMRGLWQSLLVSRWVGCCLVGGMLMLWCGLHGR